MGVILHLLVTKLSQPMQGSNKRLHPLESFAECVCTGLHKAKRPSPLVYRITGPGMGEQAQAGQVLRLLDSSIRGGTFDCDVGKEKVYPDSGYTSFCVWMGAVPVLPGA